MRITETYLMALAAFIDLSRHAEFTWRHISDIRIESAGPTEKKVHIGFSRRTGAQAKVELRMTLRTAGGESWWEVYYANFYSSYSIYPRQGRYPWVDHTYIADTCRPQHFLTYQFLLSGKEVPSDISTEEKELPSDSQHDFSLAKKKLGIS